MDDALTDEAKERFLIEKYGYSKCELCGGLDVDVCATGARADCMRPAIESLRSRATTAERRMIEAVGLLREARTIIAGLTEEVHSAYGDSDDQTDLLARVDVVLADGAP